MTVKIYLSLIFSFVYITIIQKSWETACRTEVELLSASNINQHSKQCLLDFILPFLGQNNMRNVSWRDMGHSKVYYFYLMFWNESARAEISWILLMTELQPHIWSWMKLVALVCAALFVHLTPTQRHPHRRHTDSILKNSTSMTDASYCLSKGAVWLAGGVWETTRPLSAGRATCESK